MTDSALARDVTSAETIHGQREYLLPSMLHLYDEPLVLAEGEGVRVRDPEGKEYLDLFSGILTTSVGHCNPRVLEATSRQMHKLGHISTLYAHETHVEAARKIADIAPGSLKRTFFSNSGTEAIETALMMACLATGRSEIIALRVGYPGRSVHGDQRHGAFRMASARDTRRGYQARKEPEHVSVPLQAAV